MTNSLLNILFPPSKLSSSFPWTLETAGKKYFAALGHFAIGTFAPVLLFMGLLASPLLVPVLEKGLADSQTIPLVLTLSFLSAAALAALLNAARIFLSEKSSWKELVSPGALLFYVISSLYFTLSLPLVMRAIEPHYYEIMGWLYGLIADKQGNPSITFQIWLSAISFFCGFGMQLRYIAREVRKSGVSFRQAMGLSFKPLAGNYRGSTLVNLILPVLVAYGLSQAIGYLAVSLMGPTHQPTVELAKEATGNNFMLFALMAVVGAPIFEELIFRGFLMQVIRGSLMRGQAQLLLKTEGFLLWRLACNGLARLKHGVFGLIHTVFGGKHFELGAVVLSAAAFAVLHMQFNPTTLLLLFALGCIQGEVFRRSGSLYCAILLHAVNNGLDVLQIALGNV